MISRLFYFVVLQRCVFRPAILGANSTTHTMLFHRAEAGGLSKRGVKLWKNMGIDWIRLGVEGLPALPPSDPPILLVLRGSAPQAPHSRETHPTPTHQAKGGLRFGLWGSQNPNLTPPFA